MNFKQYENFEDIQDDFEKKVPRTLFKYMADWNNPYHKEFITDQTLWFASPKELNDPYDIRTPVEFIIKEIDSPLFFEKMKNALQIINPATAYDDRALRILTERRLEQIKVDPIKYFEANYKALREGDIFDSIGVFSCSTDELNEEMWGLYANNHSGFAVVFDSSKFSRKFKFAMGWVKYSDAVPNHSFIEEKVSGDMTTSFTKSTKWQHEKEFRYLSFGIKQNSDRAIKYHVNDVT